jgi:membrane protease YdiL (CAAX protease family)
MLSEKPWEQDAVLRLLLRLCFCLGIGILVAGLLLPKLTETSDANLEFYHFLVSSTLIQGTAIILVHFFLREHACDWRRFLGLNGPPLGRVLIYAIIGVACFLPLALALNQLSAMGIQSLFHTEPDLQSSVKMMSASHGLGQNICFGITTILVAPVIEEAMFRGILYPAVKQTGYPRLAFIGTSVLFGAIHANLMTFVSLTVLAMVLVWLYEKTDTLLTPILAHSISNAVNFALLLNADSIEHLLKSFSERI